MTGCPTIGCTGVGPDWADQGPDPARSIPIACPACGVMPSGGEPREDPLLSGEWRVLRHGGADSHAWREVGRSSEASARRVYAALRERIRQGGVRLVGPDGAIVEATWAPRLRTQW